MVIIEIVGNFLAKMLVNNEEYLLNILRDEKHRNRPLMFSI